MPEPEAAKHDLTRRPGGEAFLHRVPKWVIPVVLAGMFMWSGLAKAIDAGDAENLVRFVAGGADGALVVRVVWIVELVLGGVLLVWRRRRAPMWGALGLLAVFTVVLAVAMARGYRGSCGCFGAGASLAAALIRNLGLMALGAAGMGILGRPKAVRA